MVGHNDRSLYVLLTSFDSKTDKENRPENVCYNACQATMITLNRINYIITKEISYTMTAMHIHKSIKCKKIYRCNK